MKKQEKSYIWRDFKVWIQTKSVQGIIISITVYFLLFLGYYAVFLSSISWIFIAPPMVIVIIIYILIFQGAPSEISGKFPLFLLGSILIGLPTILFAIIKGSKWRGSSLINLNLIYLCNIGLFTICSVHFNYFSNNLYRGYYTSGSIMLYLFYGVFVSIWVFVLGKTSEMFGRSLVDG